MRSTLLPCLYLFCGLLITTLSNSRRVEAGWMVGVETLVAAALLWQVYRTRKVGPPDGQGLWPTATGGGIALLWFGALACSRHFASMLMLLVLVLSAGGAEALTWKRGVQGVLLLVAVELLMGFAGTRTSLWHLLQVVQVYPHGACCDQYQRHLTDLALSRAADWGSARGPVRAVPQAHGDYALVWLVVRVGWLPAAGLVVGLVALWTASLISALRQVGRAPRGSTAHGLARVWLLVGLWLLGQAVLALAVNLALLGQPVGMGFPGLSWHPVSVMMVLVWCGCARRFWIRPPAQDQQGQPGGTTA